MGRISAWLVKLVHPHRRTLASPPFGVFAAAAGIITGIYGSLFANEVRTSVEVLFKYCIFVANFEFLTLWFWCLLALSLLSLLLHQYSIDSLRNEAQEQLEHQVSLVPELVRTQPEKNFNEKINENFEKTYGLVEQWQDAEDPEALTEKVAEVISLLHQVTKNLALVMRDYDRSTGVAGTYCANVMLFVDAQTARKHDLSPKFLGDGENADSLLGQLLLVMGAQTTIQGDVVLPPLSSFSLPVPKTASLTVKGEKKWKCLPGAPLAFHGKLPSYFDDTKGIRKWCDDYGNFKPSTTDELQGYFDTARSLFTGFGSAPIFKVALNRQGRKDRDVIAVLNIHWLDARFLPEEKLLEDFLELTAPYRTLLGKIIESIHETDGLLDGVVQHRDMSAEELADVASTAVANAPTSRRVATAV